MAQTLSGIVIGFVLLAALIWPLERLWPSIRRQLIRRRGFTTDVAYWLFTPLVTRWVTRAGVIASVPPAGPRGKRVPETLWDQLAYPIRR